MAVRPTLNGESRVRIAESEQMKILEDTSNYSVSEYEPKDYAWMWKNPSSSKFGAGNHDPNGYIILIPKPQPKFSTYYIQYLADGFSEAFIDAKPIMCKNIDEFKKFLKLKAFW